MNDYDLVVIGAGSAGVWAAPFAARLGARVALVEKERIGGDCTHYGCVPSKALLNAARVAWHLRTADRYGFDAVHQAVDLARVMAGVRQAIDRVYAFETPEALSQTGVRVFNGAARFEDPHTLCVGTDTRLRARHFLVRVARWGLDHVDRAVTDQDLNGFIKVVHRPDGVVLGAQIVGARAGEIIQEFALAIDRRLKLDDLASSILVYPTYATGVQQLAAEVRLESVARSRTLKLVRSLTGIGQSWHGGN